MEDAGSCTEWTCFSDLKITLRFLALVRWQRPVGFWLGPKIYFWFKLKEALCRPRLHILNQVSGGCTAGYCWQTSGRRCWITVNRPQRKHWGNKTGPRLIDTHKGHNLIPGSEEKTAFKPLCREIKSTENMTWKRYPSFPNMCKFDHTQDHEVRLYRLTFPCFSFQK